MFKSNWSKQKRQKYSVDFDKELSMNGNETESPIDIQNY